MATIIADADFHDEDYAKRLRKAMKGFGTNEKEVIKCITSINNAQRQIVKKTYKTMFGRDLVADLKSELGGNLENSVVATMETPAEFDAHSLHHAMAGLGTTEETLVEILASRSNEEIAAINTAYHEKYGKSLEDAVMSETSGSLRRILVSLCQGNRDESTDVDADKAKADAQALFDAGEGTWGTDESEFNRIFMTSSHAQLKAVFEAYREVSDYDIIKAIKHEMSGNLEFAYISLVECARNPPLYFAQRINKACKGVGTDDTTLIRVIVSRSEVDLKDIMKAYIDTYDKSLAKEVKDECSGDYERFLLEVLDGNENNQAVF